MRKILIQIFFWTGIVWRLISDWNHTRQTEMKICGRKQPEIALNIALYTVSIRQDCKMKNDTLLYVFRKGNLSYNQKTFV